jgi:predicted DNA-binding transcriptional regulator AlpA
VTATPAPFEATTAIRAHGAPVGVERPITSLPPGSATDVQVKLARLADLFAEASGIVRELSAMVGEIRLASHTERALMCDVQPTKSLLSVHDVAERLALSERTVRRLRRQGVLPKGIEIGGVIRWRPESIDSWIAEGSK